jgi:hypothetical protein
MVDLSIPATWQPLWEGFFRQLAFQQNGILRSLLLATLVTYPAVRAAGLDLGFTILISLGFVSVLQNFHQFCVDWFSPAYQDRAHTK